MVLGTTLMKGAGDPYYSPMFPRGGLTGYFRVDVQQIWGTSPTLDITIEHKNEDDTAFTTAGSFTQITASGSATKTQSTLKEIIRLKFVVGGTEAYAGMHFLLLAPQWLPQ